MPDVRHVRRRVEAKGDECRSPGGKAEAEVAATVVDEEKLHQRRCRLEKLDVGYRCPREGAERA